MKLVKMTAGEQAAEHGPRDIWASILLCARWNVTDLFVVAADFLKSFSLYIGPSIPDSIETLHPHCTIAARLGKVSALRLIVSSPVITPINNRGG